MDPLHSVGEGVEAEEQQHQPTPAEHVHFIRVLDLHVLVGGQSDPMVVVVVHLDVFRRLCTGYKIVVVVVAVVVVVTVIVCCLLLL